MIIHVVICHLKTLEFRDKLLLTRQIKNCFLMCARFERKSKLKLKGKDYYPTKVVTFEAENTIKKEQLN